MIRCKILVGICSCSRFRDKRDTCRITWLSEPAPNIQCRFFTGGSTPLPDEQDTIVLDSPDGYDHLPSKVLDFYRFALENSDFQWLFKCDDDTYLRLCRLESLCDLGADLVGDKHLARRGFPSGGAGYLMRRDVVQAIVDNADQIPPTGPEDLLIGRLVKKLGFRTLYSPRLQCQCKPFPTPDNNLVTAHHCSNAQLRAIHKNVALPRYLHQIWLGGELPEKMLPWCSSMERLASALGYQYKLWTQYELEARYKDHPVLSIFDQGRKLVPTSTIFGLASDWFRYALLADFGGIYADTDMLAQNIPALSTYSPEADIVFSNEGRNGDLPCIGLIWCNGERGQKAARILSNAATARLLETLPPDAENFGSRLVNIARQDICVSGIARYGIGPVALRSIFIPAMEKEGYSCKTVPRPVEADRRYLPSAWLLHNSAAAWYNRGADWEALAQAAALWDSDRNDLAALEAALQSDLDAASAEDASLENSAALARAAEWNATLSTLPAHLRPQGVAALPQLSRRPAATLQEPVPDTVTALISVPRGARRILVFSNVTEGFPEIELLPGDWCIHINRARHYAETIRVPRTSHALIVRSGLTPRRRIMWFNPPRVTGIAQIVYLRHGNPIAQRPWWREYLRANPRKFPTSGFIAANLMRDLAPRLPLILVGFDPANDHGTCMWHGHAWKYEAQWYADHHFTILPPTTSA